jgi:L-ribulose-5-phosphate 3-epimerase
MMLNRRSFAQCAAVGLAWSERAISQSTSSQQTPGQQTAGQQTPGLQTSGQQTRGKALRLGVIAHGRDADAAVARVRRLNFSNCQVYLDQTDAVAADNLRKALDKYQIEATSLIVTGPGPEVYDFVNGPKTIGLVPREYRAARMERVKLGSDFAKRAGIPGVQGHAGFIPENPNDPLFSEVVQALKQVAGYCKQNGQTFRCETGQETPITLLRAIRNAGLDNIGVNFDAANLILYAKGNPVDGLDILGPYVLGVHAKDGRYPTDPGKLGEEVPIGEGKVDFPRLIERLKEVNYRGPITIEREIDGPRQDEDIRASKAYLEKLIG